MNIWNIKLETNNNITEKKERKKERKKKRKKERKEEGDRG